MFHQNWDHAVEMFAKASKLHPDNLMYRQSLTGSLRKKYKDNKQGHECLSTEIPIIRSRIEDARRSNNWTDMDLAAMDGITVNPWDGKFNADCGYATRKRGFLKIASFFYEQAVGPFGDPTNIEFLTALADIYELELDCNSAIELLEKVHELDPTNHVIGARIQTLRRRIDWPNDDETCS
jgi:hypothetical protein